MNKLIKHFLIIIFIFILAMILNIIFKLNPTFATYTIERQTYDGANDEFAYNFINESNTEISIERYLKSEISVNIPSEIDGYKVKEIGQDTFWWMGYDNRKKVKKVIIAEGIEKITFNDTDKFGTFQCISNIEEVILPSTLKYIDTNTFKDCKKLKKINIPNSVEYIGDGAFYNCDALKKVKISKNVTYIGSGAFSDCDNLTSITVNSNNKKYSSKGGVLFNKNKTELIIYPSAKETEEYKIPSSVKTIKGKSFSNAKYLISIIIPNKVTTIQYQTFYNCKNLKSIKLPKNLQSIRKQAFYGCENLTSIELPQNLSSIDWYAFKNCKKLKSLEIPSGVRNIKLNIISGCRSLKKITFKNPYCKVNTTKEKWKYQDIVIYGYSNSKAQTFAKNEGLKFKKLKK